MDAKRVDFLTRFIVESDAMSGIDDNSLLVKRQLIERKPDGHVGVLALIEDWALNFQHLLDHSLVRMIQGMITSEQHKKGAPKLEEKYVGQYRDCRMRVGGRERERPEDLVVAMDDLLQYAQSWQKQIKELTWEENVKAVAGFHFYFEWIHPFYDGNGRTGRALVYYLFRYAGLEPFIFTSEDKQETYDLCFDKSEDMTRYFFDKLKCPIK